MPFVAILESARPGAPDRLVALVTIFDGKVFWIDASGQREYGVIEPTEDALRRMHSNVSQGDRRGVFFPTADRFEELRAHVGGQFALA